MKKDAIMVITVDDVDVYFLVIDKEKGYEINRYSTEDFGLGRFFPEYNRKETIDRIADLCNVNIVSIIDW